MKPHRALLALALLAGVTGVRSAAAQSFEGIQISPETPTDHDRLRVTVTSLAGNAHYFLEAIEAGRIVITGGADQILGVPPLDGPSKTFAVGPLAAGAYTIDFDLSVGNHRRRYSRSVTVLPSTPVLSLQGGRFRARVDWQAPYGAGSGTGFASRLSDQSGTFWFFDPGNIEVTIKILDGRVLNGHFWVFIANMSTVELTVTVEDCPPDGLPLPCQTRKYHNPPSANRNFIDTAAFR